MIGNRIVSSFARVASGKQAVRGLAVSAVTMIPGDGVGPELIYSVQDIVKNTGIPIEFEEVFLSEVHYTRSATIQDAIESITRNNHVALKGVIQEAIHGPHSSELHGMNMQLRRRLDLFANVVHIKSFDGIKTRHGKELDFVIVRSFPEDGGSSYRSMSSKSPRFRSESSHSETKEERQRSRERASRTPSNRNGKSSSPDIPDAPKIEVRTADQGVVLKSRQLDQFLKSVRGEHVSRKQRQELLDQLPRVQHLAAVAPFVDTALASSNTNQSAVVPVKALVDNHRLFMAIANQAAIASAGIEKGASLSKITPYLDWISKIASWGIQEATAARRMAAIASATRKDPQLVMPNLKVAPLAVEESMSTSAGEMGVPLFGSALLKEAREKAGDSDFGQVIRKLEKRSREGSRPSRAQSSRYSQSFRSRYDSLLDQVYDSSPSSKRPSFVAIKSACQAGRLADFVQNWAQLTSDKWILSTIQGYKLEFSRSLSPSRSVHVSNARKFSLCQQNAILDEIASLLDKRAIVKVKDGANLWFSNVFLVPKKDGGNRPVINLRPLNKFIRARHFKMESISMLRSLLLPDDWLAKLDMKDAYFGVPIAASDRKWLCFKFNGSTYQFRALPFGLSSAPYVYSKVMRVVATHLRQLGLRLIVYLDDWLFLNESKKGLVQDLKVHNLLIECLKISTRAKIERIAKFAFDYATKHNRRKVTAVHKANIIKLGDGLFLKVCQEMAKLYPKIEFESMIIDNTCMQLVSRPEQFDVMVMPNLYGNIIDNLAAGLIGGAGVVSGQSVGSDYVIFEPGSRHSFQEAIGRQIANPTAMILSASNMLNHLHLDEYGRGLRLAVEKVIKDGKVKTRDLGGYASTSEFTDAIIENFRI
ncbi:hypothetical protein QR680_014204 [Steinernema hermaphroditum]|uniref:Reverse transcriptase domain-containing protein n=1 Tax=Steinernema hermaphroditum TaxID=289476 RepID=A0AA39IAC6_9BILA|nr:hypothetical protein QR680_014204 [Steinernema hermaphroditum]